MNVLFSSFYQIVDLNNTFGGGPAVQVRHKRFDTSSWAILQYPSLHYAKRRTRELVKVFKNICHFKVWGMKGFRVEKVCHLLVSQNFKCAKLIQGTFWLFQCIGTDFRKSCYSGI
jgi:hypothetical protein